MLTAVSGVVPSDKTIYCPVSAATVLGATGAIGDRIRTITVSVNAADATSAVTLTDGAAAVGLVPASAPVGVYNIVMDAQSMTGAWTITTLAGATAIASGDFL